MFITVRPIFKEKFKKKKKKKERKIGMFQIFSTFLIREENFIP